MTFPWDADEMGFSEAEVTRDAFLGGRVMALQPRRGYRAAMDPVLLAAAVDARAGDHVLELGCGVGVASLCLSARVPGLMLTGVERQADYAELARRNAGDAMLVVTADLTDLPASLRQSSFDHVIANPPYYRPGGGTGANDSGREGAMREDTALTDWIGTAHRRLKPKGWLTLIHAADRLPETLAALVPAFGAIAIRPLAARHGRPATRVLIRARKGARTPATLLAPLVLHEGASHICDGEDHSNAARAILRDAAPLNWD